MLAYQFLFRNETLRTRGVAPARSSSWHGHGGAGHWTALGAEQLQQPCATKRRERLRPRRSNRMRLQISLSPLSGGTCSQQARHHRLQSSQPVYVRYQWSSAPVCSPWPGRETRRGRSRLPLRWRCRLPPPNGCATAPPRAPAGDRPNAGGQVPLYESTMENVRGFVDLKSKYDHGIYRILNENLKFPAWSLAV